MKKPRIIATSVATLALAVAAVSAEAQPIPTQLPSYGPQHIHRHYHPWPGYIVMPSSPNEWRDYRDARDARFRIAELEEQVEELKKELAKYKPPVVKEMP